MIDVNAAGRPHWPLALCTMAAVLAVLLVAFSLTSYGPAEPVAALLSSSGGSAVVDEVPRSLYSNATEMLVGAMRIESFSSARANGPIGENVTGHGLIAGGEAICNCACYAADDFTFCRNTAKTTVGVATYAYDPQLRRWEARGLRFFRAGSPGAERQGRSRTSFVAEGVLPRVLAVQCASTPPILAMSWPTETADRPRSCVRALRASRARRRPCVRRAVLRRGTVPQIEKVLR